MQEVGCSGRSRESTEFGRWTWLNPESGGGERERRGTRFAPSVSGFNHVQCTADRLCHRTCLIWASFRGFAFLSRAILLSTDLRALAQTTKKQTRHFKDAVSYDGDQAENSTDNEAKPQKEAQSGCFFSKTCGTYLTSLQNELIWWFSTMGSNILMGTAVSTNQWRDYRNRYRCP